MKKILIKFLGAIIIVLMGVIIFAKDFFSFSKTEINFSFFNSILYGDLYRDIMVSNQYIDIVEYEIIDDNLVVTFPSEELYLPYHGIVVAKYKNRLIVEMQNQQIEIKGLRKQYLRIYESFLPQTKVGLIMDKVTFILEDNDFLISKFNIVNEKA